MPGEGVIASSAQLAPGDTAGVVMIMRQTMMSIDSALPSMIRRDTSIALPNEKEARRVSLWLQDSTLRKLQISEPNELGDMTEESDYWFVDNELRVAVQPFDGYYFEADRMLVWTDGTLVPLSGVSTEDRMAREVAVLDEVGRWLERLGVKGNEDRRSMIDDR
jgi:hypothetical protein